MEVSTTNPKSVLYRSHKMLMVFTCTVITCNTKQMPSELKVWLHPHHAGFHEPLSPLSPGARIPKKQHLGFHKNTRFQFKKLQDPTIIFLLNFCRDLTSILIPMIQIIRFHTPPRWYFLFQPRDSFALTSNTGVGFPAKLGPEPSSSWLSGKRWAVLPKSWRRVFH